MPAENIQSVAPIRLQRTRTLGFDLQLTSIEANGLPAVYVGRPGKWGNPCRGYIPVVAVGQFLLWLDGAKPQVEFYGPPPTREEIRTALRGKNLACWCKLGQPCHADVLLRIANDPTTIPLPTPGGNS